MPSLLLPSLPPLPSHFSFVFPSLSFHITTTQAPLRIALRETLAVLSSAEPLENITSRYLLSHTALPSYQFNAMLSPDVLTVVFVVVIPVAATILLIIIWAPKLLDKFRR